MQGVGLLVLVVGVIAIVRARNEGATLSGSFAGGAGLFIVSGSLTILVSVAGNIAVILKLRPLLIIVRLKITLKYGSVIVFY